MLWPLIWRGISALLRRFMARRAEDMMRRMMGMPSRKEEKRRKRGAKTHNQYSSRVYSEPAGQSYRSDDPARMMKKVAEDVEFTEIREFESKTTVDFDPKTNKLVVEEQVSDVEFTEIKS